MNMTEWLLSEKIAHHWKHAQNIIVLLKLFDLYNEKKFDEIKVRAHLYRDWKNAGENTQVAADNAITGKPIPAPLLEGVLHSEATWDSLGVGNDDNEPNQAYGEFDR